MAENYGKYVQTLDKRDMLVAAERLRGFDHPALVIWAPEDRIMLPRAREAVG